MKDFLDRASKAYYTGIPIISDEEFDYLSELYNYEELGTPTPDGIPHYFPMYSLKKVYSEDELPFPEGKSVKTLKLDGAAVSLLYAEGKLVQALTRGDGSRGRDVLEKLKYLVPNQVPYTGVFQVTGEVVSERGIDNARNVASGVLALLDNWESKLRSLHFIAYDSTITAALYSKKLQKLHSMGFSTVDSIPLDSDRFPTDGYVYRLESEKEFINLGYTSRHPRGAVALKERKQGVETTLLDVVWQVGKSGVVSPVAILDPVLVEGAKVSRATLHNIEYINMLGLEIGCKVEVVRAGDIIPRVVKRV